MKKDVNISEEQLNAFIDGELESEERNHFFDEAEQSSELDQRVCQQRKLKELVKHAYRDVPEPKRHLSVGRIRNSLIGLSLAASILLLIGLVTGIFVRDYFFSSSFPTQSVAEHRPAAAMIAENYILHVISGEPEQMKLALEKANDLLASTEPGRTRQVEVVANERGLDLLRSDITPFAGEISTLADKNVLFYACSKAIQRLEDNGVDVRLVPEAKSGYSALDRVVIRMKDGWQYVKI